MKPPAKVLCLFRAGALAVLMLATRAGGAETASEKPSTPASEPPPKTRPADVWISSSSGLFRCFGGTRTEEMDLLGLADRVAHRLEAMLGQPIPRPPGYPVYLVLHAPSTNQTAAIFVRKHLVQPGGWAHRMDISGLSLASPERVTSELVRLLLERCTVYLQTPEARERQPASPPPGLCGGVARVIFPPLRETALHAARVAWLEGAANDPIALWGSEKSMGPPDDARAGAAVEWALNGNAGALREIIQRTAQGETLSLDQIAVILKLPDADAARRDWHLWIAACGSRLTPWAQTPAQRAADLREALTIDHAVWPHLAPADAPERIGPEWLAQHRAEPWIRNVIPLMIHQLRSVPTGGLPELDRAAQIMDEALLALRWPEPSAPWKWLPGSSRTRSIQRRIEQANELIRKIELPSPPAEKDQDPEIRGKDSE